MGYLIINNNLEVPILGFQEQTQENLDDRYDTNYVISLSIMIDSRALGHDEEDLNILLPFFINNSITSLSFKSDAESSIFYTTTRYDHIDNLNTNFGELFGNTSIEPQIQINLEVPLQIPVE